VDDREARGPAAVEQAARRGDDRLQPAHVVAQRVPEAAGLEEVALLSITISAVRRGGKR
jgi:hypothetical protein